MLRHRSTVWGEPWNETHIKQGSLFVQQKSSQLCLALESLHIPQRPPLLKWRHSPILSFYTAFLHQCSYFFSLMFAMVGHFLALFLLSVLRHCLQFGLELEHIWPGKSRHCTCTGKGHCSEGAVWGRVAASSICTRMIDTSQTHPLALIGCVDLGAVDSCKSNYVNWVDPQTVDFYTADLYLILLSDHNENFSKYKIKKS